MLMIVSTATAVPRGMVGLVCNALDYGAIVVGVGTVAAAPR